MARGIMADKRDKVVSSTSEHIDSKNQHPIDALNHSVGTSASCTCTKISTMQLFYEMKQKFPTVPDHVVCEFVGQNCHNRSACIDSLEDYPNSANVYPQALRNQPNKKKINCNNKAQNDLNKSIHMCNITKENCNGNHNVNVHEHCKQMKSSMPSNTLNLTNLNCCSRPVSRPTRQAPPPPSSPISIKSIGSNAKSLPNQPLNLSVNVIVSPASRLPKPQQSVSHYSFTLHQPNNNSGNTTLQSNNPHPEQMLAATVAATTAAATTTSDEKQSDGPSLKYTSSAYDAEIGYQSRLEITVAGTNPKLSNNNNNESTVDSINNRNSISLTRSCDVTTESNLPSIVASSEFIEETETVHHQILCKQKLVLELEKDRKRLERMQRELQAIQQPIPNGGLNALSQEIEQLRTDCRNMAQLVEEAGPSYALGETNEAFYRNIYTGQQLPVRQPLRPHRPAPAPDFNQLKNCQNNHTTGIDSRFIPITPTPQPTLNPPFGETNEDAGWTCDLCTFQNKYTQRTCEACTMPFLSAGNQMDYNNGICVPPSQPPYPLTHCMPMPMPMHSMPYSSHNNNDMPYVYYETHSLPPQYYPTQ